MSFDDPFLTPKLAQGFTTEVINPDGLAPAPVAPERWQERQTYLRPLEGGGPETGRGRRSTEYLDALDATRPALSLVPSIGHGAVRDLVLGGGRVAPTRRAAPCDAPRGADAGFEAGCRMLSFGLVYLPGAYARHGGARRRGRGGRRVRRAARPSRAQRGTRPARGDLGVDRGRPPGRCPAACLAPQVARRREPDRAAARAAREARPRSSTSRSTSTPTAPAAPCSRASCPAGRRRAARRARCSRAASRTQTAAASPTTSRTGLPGWENILGTLGPEHIEIANAAPPNEDAGRASPSRRSADRAGLRPGRRRPRPDARVDAST